MPVQDTLSAIKAIQQDLLTLKPVPGTKLPLYEQQILPKSLFLDTRGYLVKVVDQINGCYAQGWFDACAVMIRRLLEMLIIECFEKHRLIDRIKTKSGDIVYLDKLINTTLNESNWNLDRTTRRILPEIKNIGNRSAHSRRYNSTKRDIAKVENDLRVAVEELLYLAGLIR